ncbi:hypothetical protein IV454_13500 [Massilia antarctica]|uniref:AIPR protein n=1 Tax=Massilia antarctica TaxID=2765360 RepID=A0AA48WJQ9_9BURK|nr:hypothetical protein [Massilia antarctica]QPI52405.1 hypothetical protein IV454_13500 [Massilia antarctica]
MPLDHINTPLSASDTAESNTPQEAAGMPDVVVGFACPPDVCASLLMQRSVANAIHPELVEAGKIRKQSAYKRFQNLDAKDRYRDELMSKLVASWTATHGAQAAQTARLMFIRLASELKKNGAVIFGSLVNSTEFRKLVDEYTRVLHQQGSQSLIHSYMNLGHNPEFLSNPDINGAFLHPLLVAMISYQMGGPVRIVDARGKDAEPISVLALDNMLHIDNTPFNEEYKIILTWERGTTAGPKGQNFVFIPGSQHGARNCFVNEQGAAWSSENASIFITEDKIQQAFDVQFAEFGSASPVVVEAAHPDKPLTSVFAAGAIVHHRYRTEVGEPRSCLILAFHRADDNPGQFVDAKYLADMVQDDALNRLLMGFHGKNTEAAYIEALVERADRLFDKLIDLDSQKDGAEMLDQGRLALSPQEVVDWKKTCTLAPTVAMLKDRAKLVTVDQTLPHQQFVDLIERLMIFDKHCPLDLILYEDNHEEIRKWTRNQIREMQLGRLKTRLNAWTATIGQPTQADLLDPAQLRALAMEVSACATQSMTSGAPAVLGPTERISAYDAYRSLAQFLVDIGESIVRCENSQHFLSTCLFVFWATDTLDIVQGKTNPVVHAAGAKLLANYIATAILLEMQKQKSGLPSAA